MASPSRITRHLQSSGFSSYDDRIPTKKKPLVRPQNLEESFQTQNNIFNIEEIKKSPYIVQRDSYNGGGESLSTFIERERENLSVYQRWQIIEDILRGLSDLHYAGVIHTNLTLENIHIHRDEEKKRYCAKISGLEYARFVKDIPEKEKGKPFHNASCPFHWNYTEKGDIFAVGLIIVAMVQKIKIPKGLSLLEYENSEENCYLPDYGYSVSAKKIRSGEDYIGPLNRFCVDMEGEYKELKELKEECHKLSSINKNVKDADTELKEEGPKLPLINNLMVLFEKLKQEIEAIYVKRPIGEGTNAWVFHIVEQNVVLKEFKPPIEEDSDKLSFQQEVEALTDPILQSSLHIVRLMHSGSDKAGYWITFEPCNEGDLERYLQYLNTENIQLEKSERLSIAFQIANGLQEIHSRGIVHGDLTSANILLQMEFGKLKVKIADFGVAYIPGNKDDASPPYHSRYHVKEGRVSAVDMFAFGLLLLELKGCHLRLIIGREKISDHTYSLVYGDKRYNRNVTDSQNYILEDVLREPLKRSGYNDIVSQLLTASVEQRLTAPQTVNRLAKCIDTFYSKSQKDKSSKPSVNKTIKQDFLIPSLEHFYKEFPKFTDSSIGILREIKEICETHEGHLEKLKKINTKVMEYRKSFSISVLNIFRSEVSKQDRVKLNPLFDAIENLYNNKNVESLCIFNKVFLDYRNEKSPPQGFQHTLFPS